MSTSNAQQETATPVNCDQCYKEIDPANNIIFHEDSEEYSFCCIECFEEQVIRNAT